MVETANTIINSDEAKEIHLQAGENVAMSVSTKGAVIITASYPMYSRAEVLGLLECAAHKQEVPSTNFLHYGWNELELAQEVYAALVAVLEKNPRANSANKTNK